MGTCSTVCIFYNHYNQSLINLQIMSLYAMQTIDDLRKSRGLHSVRAFGHGPVYMPAGVAQSRHAFVVGGTVSTWGR